MEKKNCADLSNAELKTYCMSLENEYEKVKADMRVLCKKMEELEAAYTNAQNEINLRKTIF